MLERLLRKRRARQVAAGLSYAAVSIAMTLVNKAVAVNFSQPWGLILVQNFIATSVLLFSVFSNIVEVPMSYENVKVMLPLNFLFVLMLFSSISALRHLSVPLMTVFKNCTNILIVGGDYYFYRNPVTWNVVGALGLILLGAVLAGYQDIVFNASGVFWICVNCMSTAGYSLYMKRAKSQSSLSPTGMTFYNNALSLPVISAWLLLTSSTAAESEHKFFLANIAEDILSAGRMQQLLLLVCCLLLVQVAEHSSSLLAGGQTHSQ